MRRQVVACPAENTAAGVRNLLPELVHLANQGVDLLLLADDDLVQLVEQVFIEAGLDLKLGQAVVYGVVGLHAAIGHELTARLALLLPFFLSVLLAKGASYNFSFTQEI